MYDKSPLETDIERFELVKVPVRVIVLVIVLAVGLGVLGIYALKLRQEVIMIRTEIVSLKNDFDQVRAGLLGRIWALEEKNKDPNVSRQPAAEELTVIPESEDTKKDAGKP